MQELIKPTDPILAYFGNEYLVDFLDIILESTFDESIDQNLFDNFFIATKNRIDHDSKDLLDDIESIKGETFSDIVNNLAFHIQKTRKKIAKVGYVGIHESWNIDSFPALARSFPYAKFLVIIRDPRSTINSSLGFAKNRPDTRAQIISFARHYRKYIRLINYFMNNNLFSNRLLIIKHEDTLNNPSFVMNKICDFLGLKFTQDILDPSKYFDYASKLTWTGNSAFDKEVKNFDPNRNSRWKETLSESIIKAIEFLCNEEMEAMNYELMFDVPSKKSEITDIYNTLFNHDYLQSVKWRTDLGKPMLDFGFESFRSTVNLSNFHDSKTIRLCNLFIDDIDKEKLNQYFIKK